MAKAKKLPSGSWRVQYTIDGKRYSVTAGSAKKAEYLAQKHQIELRRDNDPASKTFGKAIDDYIELKSNILSPSTIRGYRQPTICSSASFSNVKVCPTSAPMTSAILTPALCLC